MMSASSFEQSDEPSVALCIRLQSRYVLLGWSRNHSEHLEEEVFQAAETL
jgi:hypothetical protein